MLYREADIEAIVQKIETLVGKLDDPALEKAVAIPMIFEAVSLFEQLIQLRAEMKRARASTAIGAGHDAPAMRTAGQ